MYIFTHESWLPFAWGVNLLTHFQGKLAGITT